MELVDTHCHIQSVDSLSSGETMTRTLWAKDPDLTSQSLITEAVSAGVTRLLCVGCDVRDSQLAIQFVRDRPHCWASIGIHPHEAKYVANDDSAKRTFAKLVAEPKVIAIGECGFDFFYNHSPKTDQVTILRFQIELALMHNLPLIFHVREAFEDFWPVFDSYSGIRGVVHSFTDTRQHIDAAIERGLYIGVNGIATFAKDQLQLGVYRDIPLAHLLLETDAPFLTPTPYRGSINQPKRIVQVAEFLTELRAENLEEIAAGTTANARKLFGI